MPHLSPRRIKKRPTPPPRRGVAVLTTRSSARNLNEQEKAASHNAMMHRFQLRRVPSEGGHLTTTFNRADHIVIDTVIGGKKGAAPRFSLHRLLRSWANPKKRRRMLQSLLSPITPNSWISTVHGIVMLGVYHFQLLYLPFAPSYYPQGSSATLAIGVCLEVIFFLDLLLTFNTAYVQQGMLVTSRRKIAHNYIHKWFALDLLSAIPVQMILSQVTESIQHGSPAALGYETSLMALRLLRLTVIEPGVLLNHVVSLSKHMNDWFRYSRYSHLLGIVQLMWLVLLIAHYMACFWHLVSGSHLTQSETVAGQYIADYYYAVSLIQGQGNTVGSWDENLFSSIAIIMGSVVLATVFGNVAMLVSNFNANSTNYHRKMEAVYATMDKMDLPPQLRERVNQYYTHVWAEYEALDGNINNFQKELTHTLGLEIGLFKFMALVVKVPFWKDCTPDFATQLVLGLSVRAYMPDDYVVRRRETGSEMMMISRGYCKLSKPLKNEQTLSEVIDKTLAHVARSGSASTVDSTQGFALLNNHPTASDSAEEIVDSDDMSSDDAVPNGLTRDMFGVPLHSRRLSFSKSGRRLPELDDFTDRPRSRHGQPRGTSNYQPGLDPTNKVPKHRMYLYPGDAFGEMSLLMNYKRTANIRAVTFVEMCVLDRDAFQKIIARYPEDRRRVLTKMLESCIEKKEIPFPWENIIEAVASKRRASGNNVVSRAGVIATMTAAEAAATLVEQIDVNLPDDSIKYGFQSFGPGSGAPERTNALARAPVSRRKSAVRSTEAISRKNSKSDGSTLAANLTDTESSASAGSRGSGNMEQTLENMMKLMHSMADSIGQLQQDVNYLKGREHYCVGCHGETNNNSSPTATAAVIDSPTAKMTRRYSAPIRNDAEVAEEATPKEEGAVASVSNAESGQRWASTSTIGESKSPAARPMVPPPSSSPQSIGKPQAVRKRHSNLQETIANVFDRVSNSGRSLAKQETGEAKAKVLPSSDGPVTSKPAGPVFRREEAAFTQRFSRNKTDHRLVERHSTLADMLWKRSDTDGNLLKYTIEERNAANERRQVRTRRSLPLEVESSGRTGDAVAFDSEHETIDKHDKEDPLRPRRSTVHPVMKHSGTPSNLDSGSFDN
ncbi:hypothetical protein BBJ28_00018828 [Nothophytophthora sp. Chile5]|nr:hypothetical protein BBJ28_00018828 [Nothophytophthora sp. Chile5]